MLKINKSLLLNEQDVNQLRELMGLIWNDEIEIRIKSKSDIAKFAVELRQKVIG